MAGVRSLFSPARARRDGDGRCEDDADGRGIPWVEADVVDNFYRLCSRKRPGSHCNRGAAQGFRLRTALWHVPRNGSSVSGIFWNADCILVSGTAGGALMTKAHLTGRGV